MLDRTQPPLIKDAIDFEISLPRCEKELMNNGIELYHLNMGAEPVMQLEFVFEAGLWQENKTAVAQAVGSLLKSGTKFKKSEEIEEAFEFYGASLKVMIANDYANVVLHCLTKHLEKLLPTIKELFTDATFPEDELEIYKQNTIQALQVKLMTGDFVANRQIEALIYGKQHPYGRYTEIADIHDLKREDLLDFFLRNYSSRNCKIFMSGKFEDSHLQLVKETFGFDEWNNTNEPMELEHSHLSSSVTDFEILNDEKSVQAAIRLGKKFENRSHPDFIPMQLLITIFGGYFGSRLMSNIREEKGYTYGIYSYLAAYKNETSIIISSEVSREFANASIEEVQKEMKRVQEELIPEEELLLVKNYALGNLLGDIDGPFSIMKFWKNNAINHLPDDYFDQNVKIFKTATANDLQALAQKYFSAEEYYKIIVI